MKKVVIIGAGIGGLATANLLAKGGYEVAVYEQHADAGGRAGRLSVDGFTFDTGPSWYLMPEVFEHYFELLGLDVHDLLDLQRLDPAYKVFFEGGHEPLTIHADLARDMETFDAIEPGAGKRLATYLEQSAETYDSAIADFLYTNFDNKLALAKPAVLRQLPKLAARLGQPIDRYVSRFFKDARLRQIMQYPMVFLGTSPFEAPAMYSLMSHMDFTQGVYYPQGGLYGIIEQLVTIGKQLGVTYHNGTEVVAINTDKRSASGIKLVNGESVPADIVISAADLHFTETQLVPEQYRTYPESYWTRKQAGPSALLLYLGVRGELPQLQHHNLLFTEDWKINFNDIFHNHTWPEPASLYVCKPSQTDPSAAPKGHENLFVLVPAPAGTNISRGELNRLADSYLAQIADMIGCPDLTDRITVKKLYGPDDFTSDFNSWQGTALGLSHRLTQSALFRPSTKSRKLDNLYYVGGNVMPGIGLPMCLIGAELVYKRLAGDTSGQRLSSLTELPRA